MTLSTANTKKTFLMIALTLISGYFLTASAQEAPLKSRVAVVSGASKTNIWVSDFPKKTSVVIMDDDDNLLTIISTNDYGAAFISLPSKINTKVIVKTLDGEIMASNKPVVKQQEENVVAAATKDVNKA